MRYHDGMITARTVNGARQLYSYDVKGQLTKVAQNGQAVEEYVYDAAGNILKKTVEGKTTTFTYDAANQLVSAKLPDGTVKDFAYDAAGRMVKQGDKSYAYGWMNKVMSITEAIPGAAGNNALRRTEYDYQVDGQVSSSTHYTPGEAGTNALRRTEYLWDGLALIGRGDMNLTNEPYVTGGNPVIAGGKTLFNDILGTSQGSVDGEKYSAIKRDSFGEVLDNSVDGDYDYFTGKPMVEGLGYAFLFRSYQAGLGKWTTSDPLGYPDGWNNFAYCNNKTLEKIDPYGLCYDAWDSNGRLYTEHKVVNTVDQNYTVKGALVTTLSVSCGTGGRSYTITGGTVSFSFNPQALGFALGAVNYSCASISQTITLDAYTCTLPAGVTTHSEYGQKIVDYYYYSTVHIKAEIYECGEVKIISTTPAGSAYIDGTVRTNKSCKE